MCVCVCCWKDSCLLASDKQVVSFSGHVRIQRFTLEITVTPVTLKQPVGHGLWPWIWIKLSSPIDCTSISVVKLRTFSFGVGFNTCLGKLPCALH